MTWPISWSRSASVLVSAAVCVEKRTDRGALALKCRDQLAAERVDLIGVQCAKQRAEPADQGVEVQCRGGPVDRDGVARS